MAGWPLPTSRSPRSRVAIVAIALIAAILPGPALADGGTGSISGTVFDANGMPAEGVLVYACSVTCTYGTSAANGAYSVTNLAADNYRVGIQDISGALAGGYATTTGITTSAASAAVIPVAAGPVSFDVHATAGRLVSGTITAAAGGPIQDVLVTVCLVVPTSTDQSFLPCGFDITAADGTYSLSVLPGSYRVYLLDLAEAHASGYYSAGGYVFAEHQATPLKVSAADMTGINVALPAGAAIAGTVSDNGGAPVDGMTVESCLTTDLLGCTATATGTDGSYSITGLPAGSYDVIFIDTRATHPTGFYSAAGFTADSGHATPAVVGATGATGIDVKLPIGYIASGVITDAAGRPARVQIEDCTTSLCVPITDTNDDGSYSINLGPGKHAIHVGDYSGANLSGYYSVAGLANGLHATSLTVAAADLPGINLKLRRIVGGIHAGTTHTGKYVTSTVVRKGTYATARFNLGKTFAGTRVTILRATKSSTGTWSTYRRVATVVVASDGYAYYSAKASGYMAFEASESDALVSGVQVFSAPVYVRGK